MSLTSQLIEIGFAGLPQAITSQLKEIGRMDEITRNLTIQLNKEENKVLDTLKLIAKNDPSFDEEPLKKAAASISQRRLLVSQMIEEQMKALQSIYVYLDRKIAFFDNNIKIHAPQLQTENDITEDQQRKRKKKKVHTTEEEESSVIVLETEKFEEAIALAPVDPNEPLYCSCKRISFGNMIACENPECSIEWYHFSCVGLTSDQSPEMWLCPQCKTTNGASEKAAAAAIVEKIDEGVTIVTKE